VQLRGTPAKAGIAASEVLQASRAPGVYLIRVPVGQELARARALRAQGRVLDAHPNYVVSAAGGERATLRRESTLRKVGGFLGQ
jgi:hypothetical protein